MKKFCIALLSVMFVSLLSLNGQDIAEPICIGEKFIVKSEILGQEREVWIRLPEDYNNSKNRYPVHYVLDGEYSFRSYSGIIQLQSMMGNIPEIIIVAIPNIDRNYDLIPNRNANAFLGFITSELIPRIDSKYRTNESRSLVGYSLAGRFVFFALFNGHRYFENYISGSPYGLNDIGNCQIDSLLVSIESKKIVYTSMGDKDNKKQFEIYKTFCAKFKNDNSASLDFKNEIIPNRNHENNFLINIQDGLHYIFKD